MITSENILNFISLVNSRNMVCENKIETKFIIMNNDEVKIDIE